MQLFSPYALLALAPSAQPGQQAPPAWVNMVPLALLVAVFYFALIRPQQKKDKIVTASGIVAVVVTVKEKTLNIRSADAKLEITKSAIAEITERSGEPSES
jgi:preprotein translocase subunit YajC